jgi:hypothetical protein
MNEFIRLVPDAPDPTLGLSKDDAIAEANAAFQRARKAQGYLAADLHLTGRLMDPGKVNRAKLRGMLHQAEDQVKRAQAVVAALAESMEALMRYQDPIPTRPEHEESDQ